MFERIRGLKATLGGEKHEGDKEIGGKNIGRGGLWVRAMKRKG